MARMAAKAAAKNAMKATKGEQESEDTDKAARHEDKANMTSQPIPEGSQEMWPRGKNGKGKANDAWHAHIKGRSQGPYSGKGWHERRSAPRYMEPSAEEEAPKYMEPSAEEEGPKYMEPSYSGEGWHEEEEAPKYMEPSAEEAARKDGVYRDCGEYEP